MSENTEQLVIPEPRKTEVAWISANNRPYGLDLSRDGKRLLVLSDNLIGFYQAGYSWKSDSEFTASFGQLIPKFSSDGSMIFCRTDKQNIIELRRITDWELIRQFQGHRSAVTHIAVSSDGKKFASTEYWDSIAKIWNLADGTYETFRIATASSQIVFSPDSERLLFHSKSDFFSTISLKPKAMPYLLNLLQNRRTATDAIFYENVGIIFGTSHGLQQTPYFAHELGCYCFEIKDLEQQPVPFLFLSQNEKILAVVTSDGNMQFIDLQKRYVISRLYLGKQVKRIVADASTQRLAVIERVTNFYSKRVSILDFGSPNFGTTKPESNPIAEKPTCIWDEMPI